MSDTTLGEISSPALPMDSTLTSSEETLLMGQPVIEVIHRMEPDEVRQVFRWLKADLVALGISPKEAKRKLKDIRVLAEKRQFALFGTRGSLTHIIGNDLQDLFFRGSQIRLQPTAQRERVSTFEK